MGNELAKALKRKTDAQFRVNGEDYTPSIVERADGVVVYNAPAETMIPYVAGKNVNIGTSGNSKVINALMNILAGANITVSAPDENGAVTVSASIGGKPIDLTGLMDGYVLKYDSVSDSFIVGEGGGGGLAEIPQATETTLGGIKAKAKTTETAEVAIDSSTGKLYVPPAGEAENGLPSGGSPGQVLSKVDGTDYNAAWIKIKKTISLYIDDVLEVGSNLISIISPYQMTITDIRMSVDTAPTGADLIIDINKNGATTYTTQVNRAKIIDGQTSSTATLPDALTMDVGDKITLDIDQVGSVVAGENLSVAIICEV